MKNWMFNALVIVLAAVFLFSAGMLIYYWTDSSQQAEQYDNLAQLVEQARPEPMPVDPSDPDTEEPPSMLMVINDPETGEPVQILPEYAQLYTMNNDLVGWIQIPGTKLNYPVMQTPEAPNYYLKRNFQKKRNGHGCIFANELCDIDTADNITLYGHHMNDGSMFATLSKYKKKSYWEDHPTVIFDTLTKRQQYEIFAVFVTSASVGKGFRYHTFIDAQTQAEYDEFVTQCKKLSKYDTGVTPQYGQQLITLSTCEYSQTNGRLVVVARLVEE